MNPNRIKLGITLAGVLALTVSSARADSFGTTGNDFTIDFVNIGNPGNADDAGAGGGHYSSPFGGVSYDYRIGTYEISQAQIEKATASGLANVTAGAWSGNKPAANMSWFEMAAFVNWMNTSTGHHAAYQIDADVTAITLWTSPEAWQTDGENLYRHKNAYYFLPSEDEWYKAAYHKNDGVPTPVASSTGAGTVVYRQPFLQGPANVNSSGGLSAYGTQGQGGNVWELMESAFAAPNDNPIEDPARRGDSWIDVGGDDYLRSETRTHGDAFLSNSTYGFRVASAPIGTGLPEPTSLALLAAAVVGLASCRSRRSRVDH
jgi:hypothetical protein